MLIRAAFWIGVVALLMPHEPNVGFGRPDNGWWPGAVMSWMDSAVGTPNEICKQGAACKTVLDGATGNLKDFAARSISEARADIEQAERKRAAHAE
jgi:hypothetical protein